MIHTLGQIGSAETIDLIAPLIDDDYDGREAVEAIRRLNSHLPFERLSVLRRFP
jgi:hypothetical protein